jgi:hypothetical protein
VSLKARGVHRPGFRAHVSHGVLQISLRHSLSQVTVTVTRPGLRIASGHQPRVRRRTTPKLSVSVLDAGSGTTALSARLGRG